MDQKQFLSDKGKELFKIFKRHKDSDCRTAKRNKRKSTPGTMLKTEDKNKWTNNSYKSIQKIENKSRSLLTDDVWIDTMLEQLLQSAVKYQH